MDFTAALPSPAFGAKVIVVMLIVGIIVSLLPSSVSTTAKKYLYAA